MLPAVKLCMTISHRGYKTACGKLNLSRYTFAVQGYTRQWPAVNLGSPTIKTYPTKNLNSTGPNFAGLPFSTPLR